MAINIPGIDVDKGLHLFDGDEEIYLAVLKSYATNTPATLDKLRKLSAETLGEYAIKIHGLKGTSANIGAEDLRAKAKELEMLAKAGNLDALLAQNADIIKQAETLIEDINNWLAKNAPDA